MKRNLLLLSLFTLLPIYAFGDYVPGRTRASAHAELLRSNSDGRYLKVKSAHAVQFVTDGKGATKFSVSLDKRPEIPFAILKVQPNRCGRTYIGSFMQDGHPSQLQVDETTPAACRNPGATIWRVTLTTSEKDGHISHLVMNGEPEFLELTQ